MCSVQGLKLPQKERTEYMRIGLRDICRYDHKKYMQLAIEEAIIAGERGGTSRLGPSWSITTKLLENV